MSDLRLVLLLVGALVIALIWLLDVRRERNAQRHRTVLRHRAQADDRGERRYAAGDPDPGHDGDVADLPPMSPTGDRTGAEPETEPAVPAPTNFIAIHVKAAAQTPFAVQAVFDAAESAGLVYGDRQIFHMPGVERSGAPLFSVANMLEPGTFPRDDTARPTRGLTLFMCLPTEAEPGMVLDLMLHTAELLAASIGGTVYGPDHRPLDTNRAAALRQTAAAGGSMNVRR